MSLMDHSLWEVFVGSFSADVWAEILDVLPSTLLMILVSSLIMLVLGMALGILVVVTRPDGIAPVKPVYTVLNGFVNFFRSLPDVIMIILMIPIARLLFGRSYGVEPFIIAGAAVVTPFYARIVESSLLELGKGKTEAAESIGCSGWQILTQVLLPETLPSLIRGFTTAVISIVSITALAGMFGGGGLGDLAVRYGYERYEHDLLFACIYVLVAIVMLIQTTGSLSSGHLLKKRHLV